MTTGSRASDGGFCTINEVSRSYFEERCRTSNPILLTSGSGECNTSERCVSGYRPCVSGGYPACELVEEIPNTVLYEVQGYQDGRAVTCVNN